MLAERRGIARTAPQVCYYILITLNVPSGIAPGSADSLNPNEAMGGNMLLNTPSITRVDGAPGGRHYRVEGFDGLFPSVTTVLDVINKPALVPWARNMAPAPVDCQDSTTGLLLYLNHFECTVRDRAGISRFTEP